MEKHEEQGSQVNQIAEFRSFSRLTKGFGEMNGQRPHFRDRKEEENAKKVEKQMAKGDR